jgi:uracil-DNA glycosylase
LVFILWGSIRDCQESADRHHASTLSSPRRTPRPFPRYKGFFGSKPFTRANEYLEKHGHEQIRWA